MASNSSPDYKALFLKAEEERKREAALRRQAEDERELERARNQKTTFGEFIQYCHNLLSLPLKVEAPSRSTTGKIPPPTRKYCPTRLLPWTDCAARQQEIYDSVCSYLQPIGRDAPQLFTPLVALEDMGLRFTRRPLSSEQDLESYERFAVEDHVHDIITELCKIPEARDRFRLGNGVWFDNHANALDEVRASRSETDHPASSQRPRPDQFCIHRVDDTTNTLLTTVEYKPPHKLSVENLRAGLRPMNLWEEVVAPDSIPLDGPEKLEFNAASLTGSAVAQEYHVMITEGLEYSYLTNALALVLLRVPHNDPSTLYYHLCEPNMEVKTEDKQSYLQPTTAIARVLCLCLMSFDSPPRDQDWRNDARERLHVWKTSFDHTRSQIPEEELRQKPPGSQYVDSDYISSEYTTSEYVPSSSPVESPTAKNRQISTPSQSGCAPSNARYHQDSSDSDLDPTVSGRPKRGFSQIASSPPAQQSTRQTRNRHMTNSQHQQHTAQFCTQRCLLGLQQGGELDDHCPNVKLHQRGGNGRRHLINADSLVQGLKQQLDKNLDRNCTPFGTRGAYGAPFKITCASYGYTMIGKGTTARLWPEVSREALVYRVLQKAQGSAIPVFLGTLDLAKIYFLHGAGEICHMLLMAWGGESISGIKDKGALRCEISRSTKEIRSLGVSHEDLREDNILWNIELGRALIIDFHRSEFRPIDKRMRSLKRTLCRKPAREPKRMRGLEVERGI